MIDFKNGKIVFNRNKFIIKKGLTQDEFIKSILFNEVKQHQDYGYTVYFLNPQLINNEEFLIAMYFDKNNIIEFVDFRLKGNDITPLLENWTESAELVKKEEHDKWLLENIGFPSYDYNWGTITSHYEPRSCSSTITLRYSK